MQPKVVLRGVTSEWQFVKLYDNFIIESIPIGQDSVIYSFDAIPEEVSERILNTGHEWLDDTLFIFTKKIRVDLSYARRLILYQYVNKLVYIDEERSSEEKMFFYIKKAFENEVTNEFFYNYPAVDSLLHPELYEEEE